MTVFDAKEPYEDDSEDEAKSLGPSRLLIIGYALFILVLIFVPNGKNYFVVDIAASLMVISTGIAMSWHLIRHIWFWVVIGLIVFLNVYLIAMFPLPAWMYTKLALLPIAVVDYLLTRGSVRLVEITINKFFMRSSE